MRLAFISDTHVQHGFSVPPCDVLFHSGDGTFRGNIQEVSQWNDWFGKLKRKNGVKEIVAIAGNHDWGFQKDPILFKGLLSNAIYLQDEGRIVNGLSVYGTPWQPEFNNWAFNLPRNTGELAEKWEGIPLELDVLLTHAPPHRILDKTAGYSSFSGHYDPPQFVGCQDLRARVEIVKPRIHSFGHIHHSYGVDKTPSTLFINASICNEAYKPLNKPVVVDMEPGGSPVLVP